MGPAQIQNHLRRFHAIKISRQMIGRIFAEAGIPLQKRAAANTKGDPADNRFEMSRPNELWAVDFKEFWIHTEKVHGLFVIDDFSRFCVGYALTQKPTADLAIETVNAAIQRYGRPERLLSDRGPQFHAWNGVVTAGGPVGGTESGDGCLRKLFSRLRLERSASARDRSHPPAGRLALRGCLRGR
jgi:hypothetical protein